MAYVDMTKEQLIEELEKCKKEVKKLGGGDYDKKVDIYMALQTTFIFFSERIHW